MQEHGWISLHRKIRECEIWVDAEPYDKRSAWIDILLSCNHKGKKMVLGMKTFQVDRGSFITSQNHLAERWHWGRQRVRNFLQLLVDLEMIEVRPNTKWTVIVVLKYDIYQQMYWDDEEEKVGTNKNQQNLADFDENAKNSNQVNLENATKSQPSKNPIDIGFFEGDSENKNQVKTNNETNEEPTKNQQKTNKQPQTIMSNNDNNVNNDNKGNNGIKRESSREKKSTRTHVVKVNYASSVRLTEEEYQKLVDEYGENVAMQMINILNDYKEAKGKTYKSDAAAIRKWVIDAYFERANKNVGYAPSNIIAAQQELARRIGDNGNDDNANHDSSVWGVWGE